MKNRITLIVFSFLFCTANAQNKTTELPFYNYFLWYNGTIGEQAIKAKIAVIDGTYDIYYAYNHSKKWIHLNEPKIEETTITAKAVISFEKYTDGFITLELEDLWKPEGQFTSPAGEKLTILLEVALKPLPTGLKNTSLKNEFAPLALNTSIKADSISVYYAERAKADNKRVFEKQTHTEEYLDGYNKINYVDINYDGYLDISIGDAIYIFNTQLQRFEVENSDGDMYPGIENMGVYNLYEHTFVCSHFRTIMWYKAINAKIEAYEREYYREYNNPDDLIEVSENRIRYVKGVEKYSHLDLYLKENDSIGLANDIVVAVIGTTEIIEGATLILRYPSTKNVHYAYKENTWHYLFEEIDGKKTYPILKEFYDDGTLKNEKSYDEEGHKTGKWITYYENGNIKEFEHYEKGFVSGMAADYYENGQVAYTGSWNHGRCEEGIWKSYYENGQVESIVDFGECADHGENSSIRESKYYHENGQLKETTYPSDEGIDGARKTFFDNGQIEAVGNYLNNEKDGTWKSYYYNGELSSVGNYIAGEKTDKWDYFIEDGQKTNEGTYSKGLENGEWSYYDKYGQKTREGNYIKGLKNGKWSYYIEGKLSSTENYLNGKKSGICKYYYIDNGQIKLIINYKDDENSGVWRTYFETGNINEITNWLNGKENGIYEEYHENGRLAARGKYVDGETDGSWTYYHENGKLHLKVKFSKGKRNGKRVEYYSNGQLFEKSNFSNDQQVGKSKKYHSNGTFYRTAYWKSDKLMNSSACFDNKGEELDKGTLKDGNGTIKNYNENGKLLSENEYANGEEI